MGTGFTITWPRPVIHPLLIMLQFFAFGRLIGKYKSALGDAAMITDPSTCVRYRPQIVVVVTFPDQSLGHGRV